MKKDLSKQEMEKIQNQLAQHLTHCVVCKTGKLFLCDKVMVLPFDPNPSYVSPVLLVRCDDCGNTLLFNYAKYIAFAAIEHEPINVDSSNWIDAPTAL